MDMLVKAINDTKSTDPQKIALALEGMKYQAFTGEVTMRADNHQILQPMYVSAFAKVGTPGVKFDSERTGYGFRSEGRVEAARHHDADNLQDAATVRPLQQRRRGLEPLVGPNGGWLDADSAFELTGPARSSMRTWKSPAERVFTTASR